MERRQGWLKYEEMGGIDNYTLPFVSIQFIAHKSQKPCRDDIIVFKMLNDKLNSYSNGISKVRQLEK